MNRTYIGIDPGQKGALACLFPNGSILSFPMPMVGKDLDCQRLLQFIEARRSPERMLVAVVEKVGALPKEAAGGAFTFGRGYGTILGILAALRIRTELVAPQRWKGAVLADTDKSKEAAIAWVRRAYPEAALVLPGCRKPHDGIADAICLAEYGRRTYQ